jgi:hypothetical protein
MDAPMIDDTLTIFLRARLDEDAERARLAFSSQCDPDNGWGEHRPEGQRHTVITPHVGMIHEPIQAEHVVRWNPTRVLTEIAAKREVVRLAERAHDYHQTFMSGFAAAMEGVLRLYALPHADHPDYRPEWAPDARG